MRMIDKLRQGVRCLLGTHDPAEQIYTSLATSAGLHRHPECCEGGFIRMRKVTCDVCGTRLAWHPIEYAED